MYGYYIFFGRGDWGTSRDKSFDPTFRGNVPTSILGDWGHHRQGTELADAPEWSSSWDIDMWKQHIDFLVDRLQADTIALCLNGYELPYPSEAFPEAVELDHANVKEEFLQEVLDYAHDRTLSVIGLFCTTGHAVGYAVAHPEYTTVSVDGRRSKENLCHNHPEGRRYAHTVAEEMLSRYHGFDGIFFHPPENSKPCYCDYCRKCFEEQKGKTVDEVTEKEVSDFFWSSCLSFQREMEKLALSFVPDADIYCITIPGRFEEDFEVVSREIPQTTKILHWDYWSYGDKIPDVLESLRIYRSHGHHVGFIASSGWSLDKCGSEYGENVVDQISAVVKAGTTDIMYFVGAIWHEESLLATSWKLNK